ncbi:glycoside hydrolase family 3 C-terminal domain-containing protein [Anaerocolumna sp. MB42-C2]|uniref:glycoside hydrolase family 3 C-terminal domain-containing protein n=1 Tax=Anaerocolumna sp. MB42-C2 TaxID=3070997 RepID=UPI0027E10C18|nr:glycoside hydrolase family 3 C-terminal domain-containing protein [Anaerocolumna sp. MB42-C2]WMJ88629.1 glycoside hydrolase family 3 C-terminal domain-containing protein [Anaerocolumna sp. MB42-C2]
MESKKYLDESLSFEERAAALVSEMTLEEKVYQTLHGSAEIKHLGVKAYNYWNEALHGVARAGVATVFPQAIGLAATFDEEFIGQVADCISTEGRAKFNMQQKYGDTDIYKGLTFWSPNVNIFRDPRWGRGHETYGEDPYLTSRLGVSFVKGLQGNNEKYMKAAACAKHFAVHSGPEDLRHSFDAKVSKKDLNETYLPAFKACVQEGKVEAVMGAYNRTNGEPCCGSKTLLKETLRDKWGFKGHVTSDCWAIKDFHEHHMVTSTPVESVALAMNNGCDLNCGNMFVHLLQAVRDGLVKEETITQAVTRLFTTRMKLGLFDAPEKVPYNTINYDVVDSKEHKELNVKAAKKSIVLLKNKNGLLPLDKNKLKNVGVIGPNADNRKALIGNYEGTASEYVTVLEGIREYLGEDVTVRFSEGCHLFKDKVQGLSRSNDRIAEVRAVADASDVIIACLGLDAGLEGEEGDEGNEFASGDKPNLKLPGLQEDILKVLYESGKPVVLVLLSGSALAVTWADEHIPAIVEAWYPGAQGGRGIAQMLFGEFSPEGKLPVTFYRTSEELPDFTDYNMTGRTYRYMKQDALYPFAYGLSYTEFALKETSVSRNEINADTNVVCSVKVANIGKMDGAETVQVYIKALDVKDAPVYQLKGIKKIFLKAGEEVDVQMVLPAQAFALFDEEGKLVLNAGVYEVYIGTSQPDKRSICLTGKQPEVFKVSCKETSVIEA